MSTLMTDFIISLDGYAGAEGWPSYWGLEGPEYLAWLEEDNRQELVHLMGATTYRLMAAFSGQSDAAEWVALDAARKVVFSSTLAEPLSWANAELVGRDAIEAVRELKQHESRPLRTLGSLSLSRSLLQAGLVDRFRVVVFPVITGKTGTERIFDGYPDVSLELVETRTFDGGTQLLEYIPTVLDGPPTSGS
jgi:dihydrofolate reductase